MVGAHRTHRDITGGQAWCRRRVTVGVGRQAINGNVLGLGDQRRVQVQRAQGGVPRLAGHITPGITAGLLQAVVLEQHAAELGEGQHQQHQQRQGQRQFDHRQAPLGAGRPESTASHETS